MRVNIEDFKTYFTETYDKILELAKKQNNKDTITVSRDELFTIYCNTYKWCKGLQNVESSNRETAHFIWGVKITLAMLGNKIQTLVHEASDLDPSDDDFSSLVNKSNDIFYNLFK